MSRRTALAILLLGLIVLGGCGSGGGSGSPVAPGLAAIFQSSSTSAAPNMVRLVGGVSSGDMVTVNVALSGPTISSDLYSFAFDLLLEDPTVAEYVSGSAGVGDALSTEGSQGLSVLANQSGDRIIVGVSKTGGGAGNGLAAGEEVVIELTFQVLKLGTTEIELLNSPTPAALDSSGTVIPSVQFDSATASILGQ